MRIPRGTLMLGAVAAALLAGYLAQALAVDRVAIGRSDFTPVYGAALQLRDGHGADLYDERAQTPLHDALIAPDHEGNLPYVCPPTVALAALPLTAVGLASAYRIAQAVQMLLLVAAVVVAARAAPWAPGTRRSTVVAVVLAALAGTGTLSLVLLGQLDGSSALGVAAGYAAWRSGRRGWAGAALALGIGFAKPHLALGLVVLAVTRGDRRLLAAAAAAIAALAAVDVAAVGPGGVAGFLAIVGDSAQRWDPAGFVGFTGLAGSWLGDGAATQAAATAAALAALGATVVLGRAWRRDDTVLEPALAGAVAVGLLASPHTLGHDLVLCAPMAVAAAAWATSHPPQLSPPEPRQAGGGLEPLLPVLALWAALTAAGRLDLGAQSAAPPGRIVPLVLGAGVVIAVRVTASRDPRGWRRPVGSAGRPLNAPDAAAPMATAGR